MNKEIIKRVLDVANYIIATRATIRETAKVFNISKSTVHKDIQERLNFLDTVKYSQVKEIMDDHIRIRHINGGESTRQLFLRKKQVTL